MASYNEFNNNILRDTMIVSLGNCFSSVFAGFGVFSFLGHMAKRNCMAIEDVVASGPGLAFIAYPEAIGLLPAEQLFSALFFIMLVLLGIDSQFAMTDVLIAAVLDTYPHIFRRGHRKTMVVGFFCLLGFLLGFPILTNGGYHLFNLINDYSAYYGLLLLGKCLMLLEEALTDCNIVSNTQKALTFTISIHYVYQFASKKADGSKYRFISDIEEMIGRMNIVARYYLGSMWFFGTPAMLIYIIINAFMGFKPLHVAYTMENSELVYPTWTTVIGNLSRPEKLLLYLFFQHF